ncbi:hypothetical protein QWJ34_08820 [Saccharibacillus sp. CPCC 101409]|uniref:hypothetical protein n=1 Tax=Saccharibacillus sp. CPCC 101409 TaxID=3058041 RepID=UPI00267133C6|nr:hypothetical protein [Saccharibacillus sp. CPCC 101409]MDO3409862.1 hypothetical protein [Saccharibacillus sp. CPCC 101409]
MSNLINFPNKPSEDKDSLANLKSTIQKRFGVSLTELIGEDGKRNEEVQKKINRALQKETLLIASKKNLD